VKNYYAVLGLNQSASSADIKKAYRDGCKKYHPDKNAHPDAHLLFIEIHEAYEFLCNDENRRLYHISISKSKQNDRVREWQEKKRREAQARAVEYAQVNLSYNLLFLCLCLLIIVVPLYQFIQQQELPEAEQKPFVAFLVPMLLGFAMGTYAFHSWFIEKKDIFK